MNFSSESKGHCLWNQWTERISVKWGESSDNGTADTFSTSLFTVALLWPAASLLCCPPHISKPFILTETRLRAVYNLLYTVLFALCLHNNMPKSAFGWEERKKVLIQQLADSERERDREEEYIIVTWDLAVHQHAHRMDDEYYCYLMAATCCIFKLSASHRKWPHFPTDASLKVFKEFAGVCLVPTVIALRSHRLWLTGRRRLPFISL